MAKQVHNNVGTVRKSRGISIADFAKRVGVTRQTIYAIEAASYVPNTEVALKIARELEVSVEELFQLMTSQGQADSGVVSPEYLSTEKPSRGQAVRAGKVGSKWISVPASAAPYHMPESDGIITSVARKAGGRPQVHIFSKESSDARRLVLAGCDPAASLIARMAERIGGIEVVHAPASSQLALDWLEQGRVHIAGSHLEDPETGEFNLPFVRRQFPKQDTSVVTFAEWEEGLAVAGGNPKSIRGIEDLARRNVRFVNREKGSGSRALLDKLLRSAGIPQRSVQGYDRIAAGHLAAAYTVTSGDADCCLATPSAARTYGLNFIPLHRERYDFVFRRQSLDFPQVQVFLDVLQRGVLRRKLETLAGYDTRKTGVTLD